MEKYKIFVSFIIILAVCVVTSDAEPAADDGDDDMEGWAGVDGMEAGREVGDLDESYTDTISIAQQAQLQSREEGEHHFPEETEDYGPWSLTSIASRMGNGSMVHPGSHANKCTCLLDSTCLNSRMREFEKMCPLYKFNKWDIRPCFTHIHKETGKRLIVYYIGDSRFGQMFSENRFIFTHKFSHRVFTNTRGRIPQRTFLIDGKFLIKYNKVKVNGIHTALQIVKRLILVCEDKNKKECPYVIVTGALFMLDAIYRKNYGLGTHKAELKPYVMGLKKLHDLGVRIIFKSSTPLIHKLSTRKLPKRSRMNALQKISYEMLKECPGIMMWKSAISVVEAFSKSWAHIKAHKNHKHKMHRLPSGPHVHRTPSVMYKQMNILLSFLCSGHKINGPKYSTPSIFYRYTVRTFKRHNEMVKKVKKKRKNRKKKNSRRRKKKGRKNRG